MLNNSKELAKNMAPSTEDIAQLKDKCDRYYGQCLAGVFKEYLPHIAECYSVEDYQGLGSPTESVASFEISKLVLEKRRQSTGKTEECISVAFGHWQQHSHDY